MRDRDRIHIDMVSLGCFQGSPSICSFTRSMGKKWTREVLLRITESQLFLVGLFDGSFCNTLFSFLFTVKKAKGVPSDYPF